VRAGLHCCQCSAQCAVHSVQCTVCSAQCACQCRALYGDRSVAAGVVRTAVATASLHCCKLSWLTTASVAPHVAMARV
jgi:hypothetical protein